MLNFYPEEEYYYGRSPYDTRMAELQRRRAIEAERRRRAAAAEEESRRRALYEQAMMEEQERRRRAKEIERRKAMEEERRRRILDKAENERRRRQQQLELQRAEEEERRRHVMERQRRATQQPRTAIVRGRDGRLYRVQLDDDEHMDENYSRTANTMKQPVRPRARSAMKSTNVPGTKPTYSASEYKDSVETDSSTTDDSSFYDGAEEENECVHASFMDVDSATNRSTRTIPVSKKKKDRRKKSKKITIVVEDASDSEDDDDWNSPWRNRRPSPGQWLEPVEGYQ